MLLPTIGEFITRGMYVSVLSSCVLRGSHFLINSRKAGDLLIVTFKGLRLRLAWLEDHPLGGGGVGQMRAASVQKVDAVYPSPLLVTSPEVISCRSLFPLYRVLDNSLYITTSSILEHSKQPSLHSLPSSSSF